jgi:hypothetical protein
MSEVCTFFTNQKSALTVLAFPSSIIDFQPFIWDKYKVIPNYTYRINFEKSLEDIKSILIQRIEMRLIKPLRKRLL